MHFLLPPSGSGTWSLNCTWNNNNNRARCPDDRTWALTEEFGEQLRKFVESAAKQWALQHRKQPQQQQQENCPPRFPCSVCGKEEQTLLTMSLSSKMASEQRRDKQDCSDGLHFTVFSGSTFTPLSFFAEDDVVSRCQSCGMYDYAEGPHCRVCDGLML
ncbi:hypothetical protein DQ04_00051100 [Trypanosoma grayi]|uniref:hypothetical protein n=1 Tax=Trypanosoma grayi TaxID=71804 RepID=UPI0004F448FC|nr:hypothetical protein DQ04_00051100 [Trypanosoma grayi]KEG15515.1 hypothetical protein DQ04_00051100 [Trypanosoma grayi]